MQVRHAGSPVATILILIAAAGASAAQHPHEEHVHKAVAEDLTLTLGQVVDTALAVYPQLPVIEARQEQADAWSRRGRSWLVGRPSLMLRYQSDQWGSDVGLKEYEAGIELPLWSLGGRGAVQAFGQALESETEAATTALRWNVAGIVREALWDMALARSNQQNAGQSLDLASQLVQTVERRHELGDVALRDVLLARSSQLDYQSAFIDASARLLDAERNYTAFTGLQQRPDFAAETQSESHDIAATHPALFLADMAVERAQANLVMTEKMSTSGATVLVGTRRERPAFGTFLDDSIGVTLNIPFGGSTHRETAISTAARAATQARADRNQQIRLLTLAMHEAAHGLAVARENLATARQRAKIAERHLAMGQIAYEQGEIELLDLIKIQETANGARHQLSLWQIDEKRQTALYNQAVGELP